MTNDRLDFLRRRNAGRRLLPVLKEELSLVLRVDSAELNFLPLEESDAIRERAARTFPPRWELEQERGNYPFVSRKVPSAVASKPLLPDGETEIFLILPEADEVGVLRLPTQLLNLSWGAFLRAKPDGCIVVNSEFSDQFVIEVDSGEIFCLAAWGRNWSASLANL